MHNGKRLMVGVLWMLGAALAGADEEGPLMALRLRCENRANPIGIDAAQPRFSWQLQAPGRGQRQTAYRVLVATSSESLAKDRGDAWDSGVVESDQCVAVKYGGTTLKSGAITLDR